MSQGGHYLEGEKGLGAPRRTSFFIWDQRPHEPDEAHRALCAYLDIADGRSVRIAARDAKVSPEQALRWSIAWHWDVRAQHYDLEQERIRREQHHAKLDKMYDSWGRIASAMATKLVQRIRNLDVEDLTPREISTWFKIVVDVERQAAGERRVMRRKRRRRVAVPAEESLVFPKGDAELEHATSARPADATEPAH